MFFVLEAPVPMKSSKKEFSVKNNLQVPPVTTGNNPMFDMFFPPTTSSLMTSGNHAYFSEHNVFINF